MADASYVNFLKGNTNVDFYTIEPRYSGWDVESDVRDVKLLSIEKGKHSY